MKLDSYTITPEAVSLLETFINTPSVTGYEQPGQGIWMQEMKKISDRVERDAYGSAAAFLKAGGEQGTGKQGSAEEDAGKKGSKDAKKGADQGPLTVMIEAHCDEIGLVVQHIAENGFITLNRIGGSDSTIARARRVYIHGRKGTVFGVTGHTAIHLQDTKNGGGKEPSWKEIYADIGATSREEALEMVQIGDAATYADQFEQLNEQIVVGRALDNRIGGFILHQVFTLLRASGDRLKVNVIALNAVQEEVGGYGARMMSYRLMPDIALVTDVTHATDIPGIDQRAHGQVSLGKGPSVQHGGANHPTVVKQLEKAAGKAGVALQHEATSVRTGTDTDSIFHQKGGIPSALVSIPLRYMHSPVEMAHLGDVEGCVRLITQWILSLKESSRIV